MAITDYNKRKKVSPTSVTGTPTIDKAQPVTCRAIVKEKDGFEDGDFTNNPTWSRVNNNETVTVQSTTVKNGSNALEISVSNLNAEFIEHDRGTSDTVEDADRYQTWFRSTTNNSGGVIALSNSAGTVNGNDAVVIQEDGEFNLESYDSSGTQINRTQIGSFITEANKWYRLVLKLNPSTSEVTGIVYDANGNALGSTTISSSGASNLQYAFVGTQGFNNDSNFFDDVSYSTTDEPDTDTGQIILDDWTNITSESDIAIYDQNGNLLPYEIEDFDATAETATLWCWNSWVRDDSAQAQLVYGDGPASSEENVTGTWDNTGQNAVMVQHLNEGNYPTDTALDSTSNNNDGDVFGATSSTGQFDGAADFDGTDDYINFGILSNNSPSDFTFIVNFNHDGFTDSFDRIVTKYEGGGSPEGTIILREDGSGSVQLLIDDGTGFNTVSATSSINSNTDYSVAAGFSSNGTQKIAVDGSIEDSTSVSFSLADLNQEWGLAEDIPEGSTSEYFDGVMSEFRLYSEEKSSQWLQADHDASPKAGQVFFSQSAAETTPEPDILDFNKKKQLEVTDTNDAGATISKAQAIKISGGDDSTTGTGNIVLDWTNIDGKEDLAVFDASGNLLDYEIESFDATAETAVLWVYNDWMRDNNVHGQLAYGANASATNFEHASGTWNNTGQNAVMVQHLNDDPLTATDSTANDNDGTVTGAVSTTGQFDGAASFDGTDDRIVVPDSNSLDLTQFTLLSTFNANNFTTNSTGDFPTLLAKRIDLDIAYNMVINYDSGTSPDLQIDFKDTGGNIQTFTASNNFSTNTTYHAGITLDGNGNISFYEDGMQTQTNSTTSTPKTNASDLVIGAYDDDGGQYNNHFDAMQDAVRIYSEAKSQTWMQADYDASPKAGQVFFSQSAAQQTFGGMGTVTSNATGTGGSTSVSGSTTTNTSSATATGSGSTIFIEPDYGTIGANSTGTGATISLSGSSTLDTTNASATGTGNTAGVTFNLLISNGASANASGAEIATDRLTGNVDVDGSAISGVDVNVVDKTNNVLYETTTNSDGDWAADTSSGVLYHVAYLYDDGTTYYGDAEESDTI